MPDDKPQSDREPRHPTSVTLTELFRGRSPEEWRAIYKDAYDWGPDLGREIVEA